MGRDIFHDVFGDNIALFMEECAIMEEEQKNQRVQTIKQVIADQYKKRERLGYDTLQGSDITNIINTLDKKGVKLTQEEMKQFGLD